MRRLVPKLRSYQFYATWQKGSNNCFADALSRNPADDPTTSDELGEDPSLSALSVHDCIRQNSVAILRHWELIEAATSDPDCQKLLNAVRYGFPSQYHDLCAAIKPFWTIREHLSVDSGLVMKGHRIVVPQSLRRGILENLHSSHQGLTRTKARAREELIHSCPQCRLHAASQPKEPLLVTADRRPDRPFESTSSDLFQCQGWQFLVYTDRLSNWSCVAKLGRSATSNDVIRAFRKWFPDTGVPSVLFTDGGPSMHLASLPSFVHDGRFVMSSLHHTFHKAMVMLSQPSRL